MWRDNYNDNNNRNHSKAAQTNHRLAGFSRVASSSRLRALKSEGYWSETLQCSHQLSACSLTCLKIFADAERSRPIHTHRVVARLQWSTFHGTCGRTRYMYGNQEQARSWYRAAASRSSVTCTRRTNDGPAAPASNSIQTSLHQRAGQYPLYISVAILALVRKWLLIWRLMPLCSR